jgi:hypothetical protein
MRLFEVNRALMAAVDRVTGRKTCPDTRSFAAGTVDLEELPMRQPFFLLGIGFVVSAFLFSKGLRRRRIVWVP